MFILAGITFGTYAVIAGGVLSTLLLVGIVWRLIWYVQKAIEHINIITKKMTPNGKNTPEIGDVTARTEDNTRAIQEVMAIVVQNQENMHQSVIGVEKELKEQSKLLYTHLGQHEGLVSSQHLVRNDNVKYEVLQD